MSFDNQITPHDEGLTITVPGHVLVVPELSLHQRETHEKDIAALNDPASDIKTRTDIIIKLIKVGLSRHYPDVTEDDVREKFTAININRAASAVLGVRGFQKGEALAAEGGQPTGTKSTDSSSPSPAGN